MLAYVLMALKECNEQEIVDKLRDLKEVEEANVLFGEWDLIVKVETQNADSLGTFMMDKIRKIPEVKLSSTMIVAK